MSSALASEVESVWLVEHVGIPIGCGEEHETPVTFGKRVTLDFGVLTRLAHDDADGCQESEHLFDSRRNERRLRAQSSELRRMPEKKQHPAGDKACRRLVTGHDKEHAVGEHVL
jgi:hypothetical protein